MKNKILKAVLIFGVAASLLAGCRQGMAKSMGGFMTMTLEPNTKLEMITWKDDSLWYLTKPMTENDIAEKHTFRQSSEFGIFEGTVTIIEAKE